MKDVTKVVKNLPFGWREEADAMDADQLKKVVVQSSANIAEIETAAELDEELQQLKAQAKEAAAPYRDAKKAQNAKRAYALHRLEERGDPAGTGDLEEALDAIRSAGASVSVQLGDGPKVEL